MYFSQNSSSNLSSMLNISFMLYPFSFKSFITPAIVAFSPPVIESICLSIYAKFAASSISFNFDNFTASCAFPNNPLPVKLDIDIPAKINKIIIVITSAVRIKCYFFHQKYMGFRNPLNKNQILYHCI